MLGGQMVVTPVFMGAEPNCIDTGPHAGLAVLDRENRGLADARPAEAQRAARCTKQRDPAAGRPAVGDELHLCGALDNRWCPTKASPRQLNRHASAPADLVAGYLATTRGPFRRECRM
jgi:hypothetical protein